MCDVLLVSMPFSPSTNPSEGLSVLKAGLNILNISTTVLYANLYFKKEISYELYDDLSSTYSHLLLGEYIFAPFAFNKSELKLDSYRKEFENYIFKNSNQKRSFVLKDLEKVYSLREDYINSMAQKILNYMPKIIGFQSSYSQITATLAMAKMIKRLDKNIIIVLGGWNCQEPMGSELSDFSSDIDFVFSGEADFIFPQFCDDYLNRDILPDKKLIFCPMIKDLDKVPIPDFSDFYEQSKDFYYNLKPVLNSGFSRGCWWGDRLHCSFCGSHGKNIEYRHKSEDRIKEETEYLAKKYSTVSISPSDSILPNKIKFPVIEMDASVKKINFAVRPTLRFDEMLDLKKKHFTTFQPGIESLSGSLLKKMNKALTPANNIRFLRDAKSLRVYSGWCCIYDVPGDKKEDYLKIINLIPYVSHLDPPYKNNKISIQRFSPLQYAPEKYEIKSLKPLRYYKYLFPDSINLNNFAAYFEGDYQNALDDSKLANKFFFSLDNWKAQYTKDNIILHLIKISNSNYLIIDTRHIAKKKFTMLNNSDFRLVEFLFMERSEKSCSDFISKNGLEENYNMLLDSNFIIEVEGKCISLLTEKIREYEISAYHFYNNNLNWKELLANLNDSDENYHKLKFKTEEYLKNFSFIPNKMDIEMIKKQLKDF